MVASFPQAESPASIHLLAIDDTGRTTIRVLWSYRVERLWRQEGLRVPAKQPKRGRLWLAEGSLMRRRAERPRHV